MSELSVNSIIKMIIAVVVIAVVIFGIFLAFKNYIIPAFRGGTPDEYKGAIYSNDALDEIIQEKNKIGEIVEEKGFLFIYLNEKTDYYRGKNSEIFRKNALIFGWDWTGKDNSVGKIHYPGDYGVIVINEDELDDETLVRLNKKIVSSRSGQTKIYNEEKGIE